MKKETDVPNRDEFQDLTDDADDYSDPALYEPKHSPMRRKERFRTKDFKSEKKHKNHKRNYRNKIKYDFEI